MIVIMIYWEFNWGDDLL